MRRLRRVHHVDRDDHMPVSGCGAAEHANIHSIVGGFNDRGRREVAVCCKSRGSGRDDGYSGC